MQLLFTNIDAEEKEEPSCDNVIENETVPITSLGNFEENNIAIE